MKKKVSLIIALALVFTAIFSTGIVCAADTTEAPEVRVNALMVEFPDAQPFVDSNSRTLIPVRFVSEALGADVSWTGKAAVIKQDSITVTVPIGCSKITVEKNGTSSTVTMDTAAVIKEERTFVPIRFVAEALGAYVDYSNAYNTVQIFKDAVKFGLTADRIADLRKVPFSLVKSDELCGYSTKLKNGKSAESLEVLYGEKRESFSDPQYGFANSSEHWLRKLDSRTVGFANLKIEHTSPKDHSGIASPLVLEAMSTLSNTFYEYQITFVSSTALVYQGEGADASHAVVRGILTVKANQNFTDGLSLKTMDKYGFGGLKKDETATYLVDAHMTCSSALWYLEQVANITKM